MQINERKEERLAVAAALFTSLIFGFSFMFTKRAVAEASVYSLLSWRFIVAFSLMLILRIFGIIKTHFRGKDIRMLLLLSLFQPVLYFIGEASALTLVTSSEAGLLIATIPIVTMLFAAMFLKEKTTLRQKLSILLSFAGVAVVTLTNSSGEGNSKWTGYLLLLLAVSSAAGFIIVSKSISHFTSSEKTMAMMGSGAVVFSLLAALEHLQAGTVSTWLTLPMLNPNFALTIAYLGFVTSAIAFFLQNYTISKIGATRAASFSPLTTMITITAGVIFLSEQITVPLIVGSVMILAGVIGANK